MNRNKLLSLFGSFIVWLFIFSGPTIKITGQENIRIEDCYQWLTIQNPANRKKNISSARQKLESSILRKNWLPQIRMVAQASYYSEVTSLPDDIPGISFESISKDQYTLRSEINQLIYDGGRLAQQDELLSLEEKMSIQHVEIQLNTARSQLIDWFFGVLLADIHIDQLDLLTSDIDHQINSTRVAVEYGTMLRSNLDILLAEKISLEKQKLEWYSARNSMIEMLSLITGKGIEPHAVFITPENMTFNMENPTLERPEMDILELRKDASLVREEMRKSTNRPNLSAFMNLGVGRPALDLLSNEFRGFYYGGLRLQWPLSDVYDKEEQQQLHLLELEEIQSDEDLFIQNLDIELIQVGNEIEKYYSLLELDQEAVNLRRQVKQRSQSQYQNGVIRASDYIRDLHAEDLAVVAQKQHELELLKAIERWKLIVGATAEY